MDIVQDGGVLARRRPRNQLRDLGDFRRHEYRAIGKEGAYEVIAIVFVLVPLLRRYILELAHAALREADHQVRAMGVELHDVGVGALIDGLGVCGSEVIAFQIAVVRDFPVRSVYDPAAAVVPILEAERRDVIHHAA
ncbi:hypothetical protein D3C80_1795000 [compost metagenome]